MNDRTSKKNCECTINNQNSNCIGDHAKNLSEAARYMLNNGGDIEMPRRVRTPSRQRHPDDATITYLDPPLPERHYRQYETSGEFMRSAIDSPNNISDKDEQAISQFSASPLRDSSGREHRLPSGNMVEDSKFRAVNREPLTKFESLRIGDSTLREMSIGGYKIDIESASLKAREVIPLPPARLPLIFVDENLNFYHHFFNGIYEIVSYDDLMDVIHSEPIENAESNFMVSTIEDLLTVGYERSDSEAMNLIKRMLQSTFKVETTRHRYSKEKASSLFVEANLWGFPYIESTMTCKEIDLRFWLQACYKNYETSWFNTFKSTRIPGFARRVSTRTSRSSQSSSKPSLQSISEVSDHEIADMLRDDVSTISRSRRRKSSSRHVSRSNSGEGKPTGSWFR